jgi:S1-C subfamily serine protease
MRIQKITNLLTLAFPFLLVIGSCSVPTTAQTPVPSPEPKTTATTSVSRVILENKPPAPQVVTILHRLNGLKVLSLLIRNKEELEAIVRLDPAFDLAGEVHTNVIAGLALDDGHTIAAWLPEAEAEMPPPRTLFAPRTPWPPRTPKPSAATAPPGWGEEPPGEGPFPSFPGLPPVNFPGNLLEPADLRIITRDGLRVSGRYIGLDGLTGLSLITLTNGSAPQLAGSRTEKIVVGQRLRVIGPQPAPRSETGARTSMYIRIGETEAIVVNVTYSPSGGVARVRVKSAEFSPANIGGIAINDNNETLGIVDGIEGGEATIVPVSLVRMAAKRVIARQASVPRPWLGIRGEPIGAIPLERILRGGWQLERARALTEKRQGILLTSVAPGSPAALAKLKPGDVILTVNNGFVRNAEDFSWLLDEAGPQSPVLFTVARPEKETFEAMEIKLSESPDPFFGLKFEKHFSKAYQRWVPLLAEGIEAVALKPTAAARFGSTGGLLVVSVQPSTDAFQAGLRPGDVIESIDGQPAYSGNTIATLPTTPGARSTCIVVRNKEKITLTFRYSTNHESDKP